MICLFNNKATKDTVMTTNGDYVLDAIVTKCEISEKLNEDYSAQLTLKLNKEYKKEINALYEDAIITLDDEEGREPFRIVNITKTTNYIDVFLVHVTIRDTINMWCESVRPTNQTGQGAISWIFDSAFGQKVFNVTSNISKTNTAYYEEMNVYNALYGADNCFISRWGGETLRRGYNIAINDRIGADRGMQIRSKKNLIGFEAKTNIDNLCTVLFVKGFDGIETNTPIISPIANNYSNPYFKTIKFEDVKVKNENNPNEGYETIEQAQEELLRRGKKQFAEKNIDVIKATYNIKFAQLEKTEEYKNYSMIERAFLGDTVEVIEDNYNINIKVRVIARKYDVLAKKRIETTLSNIAITEKPLKVEDLLKELEEVKNSDARPNLSGYIDSMITSGLKDSYVVLKPNELLIMDTKDINTAKNVCRYNKNGMGFSQNGYFGKYEYGFTIDGKINASMITVGLLSANLIRAGIIKGADDNLIIDLDQGLVQFKKGLIEGLNSSWNLDTGKVNFTGGTIGNENLSINLDTGEVSFKKGNIQGLNSSWNLDTGKVNFTGGRIGSDNLLIDLDNSLIKFTKGTLVGENVSIDLNTGEIATFEDYSGVKRKLSLKNGKISCEEILRMDGKNVVIQALDSNNNERSSLNLVGYATLSSQTGTFINAPRIEAAFNGGNTKMYITGELYVNGGAINPRIATLENAMLQQEGLI